MSQPIKKCRKQLNELLNSPLIVQNKILSRGHRSWSRLSSSSREVVYLCVLQNANYFRNKLILLLVAVFNGVEKSQITSTFQASIHFSPI